MGLYDTGEPLASADDFLSLGGVGAGSFSDAQEPPGLDTSGRLLNVYPDPGLDKLTTGEYKESVEVWQKQQNQHLAKMVGHLEKIIRKQDNEYVRAIPVGQYPNGIVTSRLFFPAPGILAGFSLKENLGSTVVLDMFDGTDTTNGLFLFSVTILPGASSTQWFLPTGIKFNNGLWGAISGAGSFR